MMWVLLAFGLILVVVFIERALYLHRGQIRSTAFVSGIKNILAKRRLVEALTVCEETPGPRRRGGKGRAPSRRRGPGGDEVPRAGGGPSWSCPRLRGG